jgi:hypothetical protein
MARRNNKQRTEQVRHALAQEAAKIMSEQGIADFFLAKRKAAERLAIRDVSVLPRNTEIEAALSERHRLFHRESHSQELDELRRVSLRVMRRLQQFQPRLVGPVLSGTASRHSEINLHVFADQAESVALRLLEDGIQYESAEKKLRYEPGRVVAYPSYRFVAENYAIEVVVFPIDGIRQAPSSPVDGKPMERADIAAVANLLDDLPY